MIGMGMHGTLDTVHQYVDTGRYLTQEATVGKLGGLLRNNPRVLMLVRDAWADGSELWIRQGAHLDQLTGPSLGSLLTIKVAAPVGLSRWK